LGSARGWQAKATRNGENHNGDRVDLPTEEKEELQPRRLHAKSQPVEYLDKVIEEIREMMLRSEEAVIKREMKKRELVIVAGERE